jgi:hypothetical protein
MSRFCVLDRRVGDGWAVIPTGCGTLVFIRIAVITDFLPSRPPQFILLGSLNKIVTVSLGMSGFVRVRVITKDRASSGRSPQQPAGIEANPSDPSSAVSPEKLGVSVLLWKQPFGSFSAFRGHRVPSGRY